MNDLEKYFLDNQGRLILKYRQYFEVYERYLSRYRNREVVIVEIGVSQGGSLQMWKSYFGSQAQIFAVDIDPRCKALEEENVRIFIGSQSDRDFLRQLKRQLPPIDIFIDDGGHMMQQQIITFEEMYGHLKEDGIYLCEDLHTSYQLEYGGGHRRRGTFIEYSKTLVDQLNAWHSEQRSLAVNSFTESTIALHYYDSMLVIEKRKCQKLLEVSSGHPSHESTSSKKVGLKYHVLKWINTILRSFRLPGFRWR